MHAARLVNFKIKLCVLATLRTSAVENVSHLVIFFAYYSQFHFVSRLLQCDFSIHYLLSERTPLHEGNLFSSHSNKLVNYLTSEIRTALYKGPRLLHVVCKPAFLVSFVKESMAMSLHRDSLMC